MDYNFLSRQSLQRCKISRILTDESAISFVVVSMVLFVGLCCLCYCSIHASKDVINYDFLHQLHVIPPINNFWLSYVPASHQYNIRFSFCRSPANEPEYLHHVFFYIQSFGYWHVMFLNISGVNKLCIKLKQEQLHDTQIAVLLTFGLLAITGQTFGLLAITGNELKITLDCIRYLFKHLLD